jgi:hypothetical protein
MSDMQDQPARGGAAGSGTAAGPAASTGQGSAAGASGTRGGYVPRPAPGYDDVRQEKEGPSGLALGLTLVAAVFMMIGGLFDFFEGLAALIRGQFFVVLPNYAFSISVAGWGWLHLITGAIVFATGAALLTDHLWARIAGVVIASLSALMNFVTMPYYPVWAFIVIALDIFIIWALLTPRRH